MTNLKFFLSFLLLLAGPVVWSQGPEGGKKLLQDKRVQEILLKSQLYEISKTLDLPGPTLSKFNEIFTSYFYEMRDAEKKIRRPQGRLSDTESEQIILDDFAQAKRIMIVRESYYLQFKKILSSSQILQLYDLEREINKKIIKEAEERRNIR